MRITLPPGGDIAAVVRAAAAESVVVVIAAGRDPLSLAQAIVALAPLAIERAPSTRINAVLASPGADPADVEAAIDWLERAGSTTGQLVEISARTGAARTAPTTR